MSQTELAAAWAATRIQLVTFVERRVDNHDTAEDIVQDVLERYHQVGSGFIDNPQAWLYTTARNAIIDYYRTNRTHEPVDNEAELPEPDTDSSRPNQTTRQLALCLQPLASELPDKYQRALTLVDFEGITQASAAEIEGLSLSGMKSRVQRSRRQLAGLVEECCEILTGADGSIQDYKPRQPDCF